MNTLVFDTETTGIGPEKFIDLASEPFMVQFAAMLFEGRRPVATYASFTLPMDENLAYNSIPTSGFFIRHGFTNKRVKEFGRSYEEVLAEFHSMMARADRIIAHNLVFDERILEATYRRISTGTRGQQSNMRPYTQTYRKLPRFCTMRSLTDVLKIPGPYGNKWPTLEEAYKALVDPKGFTGHDALNDVRATAAVLWAMEEKGLNLQ